MSTIVDQLLHDPILSRCNYSSLSRLLPYIEQRSYAAGEHLYRANEAALGLYLLTAGDARLYAADGETHDIRGGSARLGDECATDAVSYLADAIAVSDVTALFIPRDSLQPLLDAQPTLKSQFMAALVARLTGNNQMQVVEPIAAPRVVAGAILWLGWLAAIVLPLVVLQLSALGGINPDIAMFLAIFSATVVMWMFSLVDDYVPALFAVMAILIAGLVPPTVVLAGFASDGFLMAMSILGLSTVIIVSGLSYRAMLLLLLHLPNSRFWHNFSLVATGFFLTPLIPSANGRMSLITPVYVDMVQNLRLTRQGVATTQLATSAFAGVSLFSAVFISSKTINFVVFGLLPAQTQLEYHGFKWLVGSAVAALVLMAAYAVTASWLYRSDEKPRLSKTLVASQLDLLGNLKHREWAALLGISVFILGLMTASLHQIAPPWLGLAILYGLLLFGSLRTKELKEKINWPFLLYLSGLTGMISSFNYLGVDQMLAQALPWLGSYMRDSFGLFVLVLFGVIFVLRLAVPINATIAILATLLLPQAGIYGVNPWVIGFIILVLGEIWFLPYQCSYYLQLRAVNRANLLYREKNFLIFNGLMNFARLAAIYASIPYWKATGLL